MNRAPHPLVLVAASVLVAFLVLPVAALLLRGLQPALWPVLRSPAVLDALRISAVTTTVTLGVTVLLATPLAWLLARHDFRGKTILNALLDLPLVLPPVVAGVALLLTFGREGLLGAPLALAGISLPFTTAAVTAAQVFVAAPYYLRAAQAGFRAVDTDAEQAAHLDGASRLQVFRHVTLPIAAPLLLEGLVLTWARALGEFGATILFAGSLQGETRTLTLAIYASLDADLRPAMLLSAGMVLVSFAVLLGVRRLSRPG